MQTDSRVALVTGGQRGLGFETCQGLARLGYTVLLTGPIASAGHRAVRTLVDKRLDVEFHCLDVTNDDDVKTVKRYVKERYGRLDVLVNNAGILVDEGKSVLNVKVSTFHKVLDVNTFGALRLSQAFLPLMLKHDYGRIVNVASGRGQLSGGDIGDNAPAYSLSKTALNSITVMLAAAAEGTNVLVNSVCPGWCRTMMGGANAPRSPRKGAETIIWLATLPDGGPTGRFFRDKEIIDW